MKRAVAVVAAVAAVVVVSLVTWGPLAPAAGAAGAQPPSPAATDTAAAAAVGSADATVVFGAVVEAVGTLRDAPSELPCCVPPWSPGLPFGPDASPSAGAARSAATPALVGDAAHSGHAANPRPSASRGAPLPMVAMELADRLGPARRSPPTGEGALVRLGWTVTGMAGAAAVIVRCRIRRRLGLCVRP